MRKWCLFAAFQCAHAGGDFTTGCWNEGYNFGDCCTPGDDSVTCEPVPCPANSVDVLGSTSTGLPGGCSCIAGYHGSIVATGPSSAYPDRHYVGECALNQCTCSNGAAATGAMCETHGSEACVSCAAGYTRRPVGGTCDDQEGGDFWMGPLMRSLTSELLNSEDSDTASCAQMLAAGPFQVDDENGEESEAGLCELWGGFFAHNVCPTTCGSDCSSWGAEMFEYWPGIDLSAGAVGVCQAVECASVPNAIGTFVHHGCSCGAGYLGSIDAIVGYRSDRIYSSSCEAVPCADYDPNASGEAPHNCTCNSGFAGTISPSLGPVRVYTGHCFEAEESVECAETRYRCEPGAEPHGDGTGCRPCFGSNFSASGLECIPCEAPRVVFSNRSECSRCMPGQVPNADRTACIQCEPGTVSTYGASCEDCPSPSIVNPARTTCTRCLPGEAPNADRTECRACLGATYSPMGEQCLECSLLSADFVVDAARTSCRPCSAGSGRNSAGTSCAECTGNTFSPNGVCQPCLLPNVPMDNRRLCSSASCLPGTTCLTASCATTSDCERCEPGTVSLGGSCDACTDSGKVASADQTSCQPCSPGTVSGNVSELRENSALLGISSF
eukprot:SAG22_NODE_381_length_11354_cov_6.529631_7_plen_611_part_00